MSKSQTFSEALARECRRAVQVTGEERDYTFMRLALQLASKGVGRTSPNPAVGAVIVKAGKVVSSGFHRRAGAPHAEVEALQAAGKAARGATLYVNLEPCSHYGKTPPCTEAVIAARLKRVVVGMVDPNPLVQGRGIKRLRQARIEVKTGVLKEACERLNEDFCTFVSKGRPFVILKLAASLDGKIAAAGGDARWISGETSRRFVHQLRNQVDAVLVGAETVRRDNPRLTCRIKGGRDPLRVVLDGRLRITPQAQVIAQPLSVPTLVVTAMKKPSRKIRLLERHGAEVLSLPGPKGRVAFPRLLHELGKRGVKSVMVEGGAGIAAAALQAGTVDKVLFFYAPKLLGGEGKEMVGSLGIRRVARAIKVHTIEVERLGEDMVVSGYLF